MDRFVDLVLSGREGVAFSFLKDNLNVVRSELLDEQGVSAETAELRQFWFLIGLIESGDLKGALQELSSFKPKDRRLYLGLHLGAFLMHRKRVTTSEERVLAEKICDNLDAKIIDLRKQLIEEFQSELLELQKGRVKALEDHDRSVKTD